MHDWESRDDELGLLGLVVFWTTLNWCFWEQKPLALGLQRIGAFISRFRERFLIREAQERDYESPYIGKYLENSIFFLIFMDIDSFMIYLKTKISFVLYYRYLPLFICHLNGGDILISIGVSVEVFRCWEDFG